MITCVTPNPALDRTNFIQTLHPGSVHQIESSVVVAGGKGINVARAARALGAETLSVGIIGGRSGRYFADLARAEGIRGRWVQASSSTRTCTIIVESDGDSTVLNERGPDVNADEWGRFVQEVYRSSRDVPIVTISGSFPRGVQPHGVAELLEAGTSGGAQLWFDTRSPWLGAAIPSAACIKVNHQEAAQFLGDTLGTLNHETGLKWAVAAAAEICSRGVEWAVITVGRFGAAMSDGSSAWWATSPPVRVANETASGDCFLAGLAVTLEKGRHIPQALEMAVACGAANAAVPMGAVLELEEVQRLASMTSTERVL